MKHGIARKNFHIYLNDTESKEIYILLVLTKLLQTPGMTVTIHLIRHPLLPLAHSEL